MDHARVDQRAAAVGKFEKAITSLPASAAGRRGRSRPRSGAQKKPRFGVRAGDVGGFPSRPIEATRTRYPFARRFVDAAHRHRLADVLPGADEDDRTRTRRARRGKKIGTDSHALVFDRGTSGALGARVAVR